MKKALLFIVALGFNIFLSCSSNGNPNDVSPEAQVAPGDTTKIENSNKADSALRLPKGDLK